MKKAEDSLKKKPRTAEEMKLSDEDRHRFLAYLMPQLEPLRQACDRNWLTQVVLVGLGAFHFYNNTEMGGQVPITFFGITWGTIPNQALDYIFPLVLTYLIIRLGYLLNAYLFIRDAIITSLKSFVNIPPQFQYENTERMLRSNSFVDLFCLDYKWTNLRPYNAALLFLPLILSAIFALNHILALLYVGRIAGRQRHPAIAVTALLGIAVVSCYLHFIFTTNRNGARFISIATIVLSIAGYFLIHKMAYGSY